jgi:hypothetical protein
MAPDNIADVDTGHGRRAQQVANITIAIEYPVLRKLGKHSIRRFLKDRAAYVREIKERTNQEDENIGKPVSLSFSIDSSILERLVDLRQFGPNMDSVDKITEDVLQKRLDAHREVMKDTLSAGQMQSIVTKNLRINMLEKDVEQRIIVLFADYSSLMRTNGLSWVIEQNPKVSIGHIVGVLKPIALQKRLHDYLEFSHPECSAKTALTQSQLIKEVLG